MHYHDEWYSEWGGWGGVRGLAYFINYRTRYSVMGQKIILSLSFFSGYFFFFFLFITREGRRIGRDAVIIGEASTWHPLWIRMSENCQNTQMEVSEPTFETV